MHDRYVWFGAADDEILAPLLVSPAATTSTADCLEGGDGQGVLLPRVADQLLVNLHRACTWQTAALFVDCVAWAKAALKQQDVPAATLATLLENLVAAVCRRCPDEIGKQASDLVSEALRALPDLADMQPGFLQPDVPLSPLAMLYSRALLRGDRQLASRLVLQSVEQGTPVKDIYRHVFQPAQYEVGRLWQINQISVAEEHYSTAATQLIMSQLYPYVFSGKRIGRMIVASCISGDLHELGARMVADFFEMEGWDSYYTGANTPTGGVVQAIVERRPDVLAISATLTHHVQGVADLIGEVRGNDGCKHVKVIVGGYPFNCQPGLWRRVGADGTGFDAETAVSVANRLVGDNGRRT